MKHKIQMKLFACEHCGEKFEDVGEKAQWRDPIYGPMWQRVAICPVCQEDAMEIKTPMITIKRGDGGARQQNIPSCSTGTCPWVN
jgi:hypothetical protein